MKREGRQQEQLCTNVLCRRKQGISGAERTQCNSNGEKGRREKKWCQQVSCKGEVTDGGKFRDFYVRLNSTSELTGFVNADYRVSYSFPIYLFIYLLPAVLGPRFCARAFFSCGKRGPLFIVAHGPLTIAASLVAEHRLQTRRLSSCGSRAQLLHGMWDPPRPGLEPVSPALAGRFSATAPPGKPLFQFLIKLFILR